MNTRASAAACFDLTQFNATLIEIRDNFEARTIEAKREG
jgi:hypothetical protein